MKYLTAIIAILILATAGADIASARRRNSINTRLKTDKTLTQEAVAEPFDSISATADSVRFYGYEKTLRSTRETMFVSNLCQCFQVHQVRVWISKSFYENCLCIFLNSCLKGPFLIPIYECCCDTIGQW